MAFFLPDLPYTYSALTPYMPRATLEYHHEYHHSCVKDGNALLKGSEWEGKSLEDIVRGTFRKNHALFNCASQHYNHSHFWKWMKPRGGGDKIPGKLQKQIIADFGSVAEMKRDFILAGVAQTGSGWAWLAVSDGKIIVAQTANAESPLVHGGFPILGCDLWEHSYCLCYRDRRQDYLDAFVNHLVNWDHAADIFEQLTK
jgi:superoxide dismutase, Fe-Mn family